MRKLDWTAMLVALGACESPTDSGNELVAPEPAPWMRTDERPVLDHGWFTQWPSLAEMSLFAQAVAPSLDAAHRADLGVGNGRAFTMLALEGPVNGLHGAVGPAYHRGDRFFGDLALQLVVNGVPAEETAGFVGRARGSSALITRGDTSAGTLWTVDVGVRPAGVSPLEVPPVLLRQLLVRAEAGSDVAVRLVAVDAVVDLEGSPAVVLESGRLLTLVPAAGAWVESDGVWTLPLGVSDGAGEAHAALAYVFADTAEEAAATSALWSVADPDAWLADTLADDAAYLARGMQITVDDPWLTDWIEGMLVALRAQTSAAGGVTPMSRYTDTWLRDTIGPARFWARAGRVDEVLAAARYLHLCHRKRGDIGNACTGGLLPDEVIGEPSWSSMGPLTGRVGAEGPSHLPLVWREVVRWGGDAAVVDPIWPYLRRAVLDQQMEADGRQTWSGDETFRLAMNVAFDQPLEVPWQALAWSSNSSLLMIAAAGWMAEVAPAAGHADDAGALQARADLARAGLDAFLRPEGHLAALELYDAAAPPLDAPFEDAALAGIWSGALAPEDPLALSTFQALLDQLGRGDGTIQSPPGAGYELPAFAGGFATGMVPGYALYDLAAMGHPEAPEAFAQVLAYSSPSGMLPEGLDYGDKAAFQPLYDRVGRLGDTAARYRPWEGGIVGDAVLDWLVGAVPIPGGLRVRPRAPSGLDKLVAGPVTAGAASLTVEVRWADGWEVEVRSLADAPFEVVVEIPLGVDVDVDVQIEGPAAGELVALPMGERLVRFEALSLAPGASAVFAARNAR